MQKIKKEDYVKSVTGKYIIHEKSNNDGMKACNLAAVLNMSIVSTKDKHKKEQNITRKTIANANTDHYLVLIKVKIKILTEIKKLHENKQ